MAEKKPRTSTRRKTPSPAPDVAPPPAPPPDKPPARSSVEDTDYDGAYRRLLGRPEMLRELVRYACPSSIRSHIDMNASIKPVSAVFHTEALHHREGDTVFELTLTHPSRPMLLLLEFQSTADAWMSLRVLTYTALVWEQWVQNQPKPTPACLPPALTLVLYNGERSWVEEPVKDKDAAADAPVEQGVRPGIELFELLPRIELGATRTLKALQANAWYYLVDIGRLEGLERSPNLCAFLFRLERCTTPEALPPILDALITRLEDEEDITLNRAFATFIVEVLHKQGLPVQRNQLLDLLGVRTMLNENLTRWKAGIKAEGKAEGQTQMAALFLASRLGRDLTQAEHTRLVERLAEPNAAAELFALNTPDQMVAWLQPAKNGKNGHR